MLETTKSLLGGIRKHWAGRNDKAIADFRQLVISVADGSKSAKLETIGDLLDAVRKTPDELAAAVDSELRRRQAKADLKDTEAAERELTKILNKIAEVEEQIKAAMRPLDAEHDRLHVIATACHARIAKRTEAARVLRDSAPEELLSQAGEARKRSQSLRDAIMRANAHLGTMETRLESHRKDIDFRGTPLEAAEIVRKEAQIGCEYCEREIAATELSLKEMSRELADLKRDESRLEAQLLEY